MQDVLQKNPDASVRVLVIWEPMLATDWSKPGTAALSRIADRRAVQFWDKGHLFAQELRRDLESRPGQPGSDCCDQLPQDDNGIVWDLVALFPAGARWAQPGGIPRPVFIGGAAFRMKDRLEKSLAAPVSRGVRACQWKWAHSVFPFRDSFLSKGRHMGWEPNRIRGSAHQPPPVATLVRYTVSQ